MANPAPITGRTPTPYNPGRTGTVGGLGQRANQIVRGSKNLDATPTQFLLNAKTDLAEHVRQKLLAYAAQVQVLGILAGVLGTPEQQREYREAVVKAGGSYFSGLLDRSKRQSAWENMGPLDMASNATGWLYKGSAALAGAVGWERGRDLYDKIGDAALATDPDRLLTEAGSDLIRSIAESCKARWDEFWKDLKEKGLLVAYGKLQIDGAFLAAEVAIDVALAVATGGVAGAASAGIKIIGRRVSATVTRVTIRAASRAARSVPESGVLKVVDIADAAIDAKIKRAVLDEDLLGTISKREDMARRGQQLNPPVEKPEGRSAAAAAAKPETKKLTRGRNGALISYDPQTGRPTNAKGTLRQDFGSSKRGDDATAVGKLGNTGDQGGHLVAHRFMGDTPNEGIAPQAGNLNMGPYRTMESEWADWTKKGYEVDYNIDVKPPGAVRPDAFDASYVVRDPKTGRTVYTNRKRFNNKAGQSFKRIPFRDMR